MESIAQYGRIPGELVQTNEDSPQLVMVLIHIQSWLCYL